MIHATNNERSNFMRRSLFRVVLFAFALFACQAHAQEEAPLSNADVITLSKLKLGDAIVMAKINQANTVNFSMDTDSLIKLKENGVSSEVIAAMLKRSTTPKSAPPNFPPMQFRAEIPMNVGLSVNGSDMSLQATIGQDRFFGFMGYGVIHSVFLGAKSRDRTKETQPSVTFKLDYSPVDRAYLVKLEESQKEDYRSFKNTRRKTGDGVTVGPPDDNIIPCTATETSQGLWKLTPVAKLQPGEYGLYFKSRLWAFGVDPDPAAPVAAMAEPAPKAPMSFQ